MFNQTIGLELLLIGAIATLLGIALNNFFQGQMERQRKAIHRQRIQCFITTAEKIEEATARLTQEIPAEIMNEILQNASIADLYAIHNAITKAKAATQRLEATHLGQLNAIARTIGLPQIADTKPTKQQNGTAPQLASQQNGQNPDKAGKRMIGEMLNRLKAAGRELDFNQLLSILREQHGLNNPADFAALPEEKRQEIENSLQ